MNGVRSKAAANLDGSALKKKSPFFREDNQPCSPITKKGSKLQPQPHNTSDDNMASIGKRKRGAMEVLDTPKRAKSSLKKPASNPIQKLHEEAAWKTAAETPTKMRELIKVSVINGSQDATEEQLVSPQSLHPDVETEKPAPEPRSDEVVTVKKSKVHGIKRKQNKVVATWSLSESIAGRMLDLEPVFTENEK